MDPRVTEFHNIMPIENISSVLEHGILSNHKAARLKHRSVAMQAVQNIRDEKQVPGGLPLHRYANLYFHARNPMLYRRQEEFDDLCVLRVSTEILGLPQVVLSDRNASSRYALLLAPRQWGKLDFDAIFAEYWTDPDPVTAYRLKSQKCAEVLVPDRVAPSHLLGARVADRPAGERLRAVGFDLAIKVDPHLFFR